MFILVKVRDELIGDHEIQINKRHIETIQFIRKEGEKNFFNIGMISGKIVKDVYLENNGSINSFQV